MAIAHVFSGGGAAIDRVDIDPWVSRCPGQERISGGWDCPRAGVVRGVLPVPSARAMRKPFTRLQMAVSACRVSVDALRRSILARFSALVPLVSAPWVLRAEGSVGYLVVGGLWLCR